MGTVEVAVGLWRLGYPVRNDVKVPVPVFRSRTRLVDAAIDLSMIPVAADRASRRRLRLPPRCRFPASAVVAVAALAEHRVEADGLEVPAFEAVEDQRDGTHE